MKVRVLRGGRIYTGDPRHPQARSLAMVGERVVALDDAAEAWGDAPGAVVEELDGARVLPGLVDAHLHLKWYGLSLRDLNLRDLSREALLALVEQAAAERPTGEWIRGRGWDQNVWEDDRFPTAAELDAVAPHHPVLLIAKNAHAAVANRAALRAAGLNAETPSPPNGRLGRREGGEPDGMLFESAVRLVQDVMPPPTLEEVTSALEEAQEHLLALGLTGVHDVDGSPAFAAYQALRESGKLKVRVTKYVRLEALEGALEVGLRSGYGDDWLRFGGLKLFADGALGSRTGALFAPYEGEPENVGLLTLEREVLNEVAHRAAANGIALQIHAIGDRANRVVLDTLESVRPLDRGLRHRIEHLQLIDPQDVARLAPLDVVASMQPIHAPHDRVMAERYWGKRTANAYAWRTVLDSGAALAFGSDAPIESFDPWLGLHAAVTREDERGTRGDPWHGEQRLTLKEAVRAYTWGPAYAAGTETRLGILAPGYLADLVVVDRDIFHLPPETLLETRVQRVMVGGEWSL